MMAAPETSLAPKPTSGLATSEVVAGPPAYLEALDPDQRRAVCAAAGPVRVLAAAGSGKTRMLTHRVAHQHLSWGYLPERVLAVSFTNKTVDELGERLRALVGHEAAGRVVVCTFHAAAWRLCVRPHLRRIGREVRTIYSAEQSLGALRRAIAASAPSGWRPPVAQAEIGRAKARGLAPSDVDPALAEIWRRYRTELRNSASIDFEDLIVAAVHVLERESAVRRQMQASFDALLVDEFQDASPMQARLCELLAGSHRNMTVVGDPDQAIYRFRGGDAEALVAFEARQPGAVSHSLERNYRSREPIVVCADRLMAADPAASGRRLRAVRRGGPEPSFRLHPDPGSEATGVLEWIRAAVSAGAAPAEIAVFSRGRYYLAEVEAELTAAGIPYRMLGGVPITAHAECRDVIAHLQLVANPRHIDALLRAAERTAGIGSRGVEQLLARASELGIAPLDLAGQPEAEALLGPQRAAAARALAARVSRIGACADSQGLGAAVAAAVHESGWGEELEAATGAPDPDLREELERRSERLAALERAAEASGGPLEDFLGHLLLGSGEEDPDAEEARITLGTIHAAKGLEFPRVALVGMAEGELPHYRAISEGTEAAISEERRVAYVAITRAMDELRCSAAARNRRGFACERSRFIAETGISTVGAS
ncbi:MAG: ATP-dependent helicase [Solirubrobacterales bacterium]